VNNFVFLAREGFYDNTTFHRVIAGFMAQGCDPRAREAAAPATSSPMSSPPH
jgi:cyclophilin family peptidyl-prolyl cis-trans isomerase